MTQKNINNNFKEALIQLIDERYGEKRGRYEAFKNEFSQILDQEESDKLENKFKQWVRGHIPKLPTLILLANFFHVSVDYLLGNTVSPNDYSEKFVHEYTGLDYDAIQMIKLFSTNEKYQELNRNCLDMLNLLLSDHHKKIKENKSNNNITHSNIFNDMWEYIHANLAYYQSLDEEVGEQTDKKYMFVGFDKDFCSMLSVDTAIKYRAEKRIFDKLNELSNITKE